MWTLSVRQFLLKKGENNIIIEKKIKELKKLSTIDRDKEIAKIFSSNNFILNPVAFDVFLNWEEIKYLSQNGFEVGSHGVTHQKLTELPLDKLKDELQTSKSILEKKVGVLIEVLSYPYGRHNNQVVESAKSARYTFAVSTIFGNNSFNYIKEKPFQLKRIDPEEYDTLIDFKVRLY